MKSHILKLMKIKDNCMGKLYDHGLLIFDNELFLK
jgi:hypothetical protein